MKRVYALIILLQTCLLFAQPDMTHLTEMQKIFFVSEASGLAATSNNPASISINQGNTGVVVGYDFDDVKIQGNSSVFLTLNNGGISYQDIYNINNVRLQNYTVNLSIGNEYFSIGTINRFTKASYSLYEIEKFSFDAGIIIRPASFLSVGLLARNLGEVSFDHLNYIRNYTAGIGLTFSDETYNLYADADFKDDSKIDEISGKLGLVIAPLNLLEFRAGVILNPEDILEIRGSNVSITNMKYESFLSSGFLIKNTIRITVAAKFNNTGKRTRFTVVFGLPLTQPKN